MKKTDSKSPLSSQTQTPFLHLGKWRSKSRSPEPMKRSGTTSTHLEQLQRDRWTKDTDGCQGFTSQTVWWMSVVTSRFSETLFQMTKWRAIEEDIQSQPSGLSMCTHTDKQTCTHMCTYPLPTEKYFKLKFNHITVTYCTHYLAENSFLLNSNLKEKQLSYHNS